MQIDPLLVEKPWGGDFIAAHYGRKTATPFGEAWLLSTLPDGESRVAGRPLSEALGAPLSFVVKIIDAKEPLSVQVHPNDAFARELEQSRGKTECWLILDVKPGAGVYLGLKDGVSGEEFADTLAQGRSVESLIQFVPVSKGDFILVPAGTIHAIGGGVTLLEVQQASGITYRLWDWNRPGRELHIEKGLKVASFDRAFEIKRNVLGAEPQRLLKHAEFEVFLNSTRSGAEGWFIDLESYEIARGSEPPSQFHSFIFVR